MTRRLTKREQNIFIICIFMVFIYFSYNGIIKPLKEKTILLNNQIQSKEKRLRKNLQTINRDKRTKDEFNYFVSKYKQPDTNAQVMSSIISEIEATAKELDLRISNLKPKKVKGNDYSNRFSVSLTINSEFEDIMHFLYLIQSSPHFFEIEEVRFDKGSRRRSSLIKTSLVLGKIYIP